MEYACRAGSTTDFHNGDDPEALVRVGNILDAAAKEKLTNYATLPYLDSTDNIVFTAPVGQYRANAFGLYDMHGNVFEWCSDWKGDYTSSAQTDPTGPGSGLSPVLRGGSWGKDATYARSALRLNFMPGHRSRDVGFRVVAE